MTCSHNKRIIISVCFKSDWQENHHCYFYGLIQNFAKVIKFFFKSSTKHTFRK